MRFALKRAILHLWLLLCANIYNIYIYIYIYLFFIYLFIYIYIFIYGKYGNTCKDQSNHFDVLIYIYIIPIFLTLKTKENMQTKTLVSVFFLTSLDKMKEKN